MTTTEIYNKNHNILIYWKRLNLVAVLIIISLQMLQLFVVITNFFNDLHNPGRYFQYDFAAFYVASAVLNSEQPILYNDQISKEVATAGDKTIYHSRYIYPPFFAVVLRPLAKIPFQQSVICWLVLNLFVFSASVYYLLSISRIPINIKLLIIYIIIGLSFPPVRLHLFSYGQSNLLILLLIILYYFKSKPGCSWKSQALAGVFLGLAIGIKLFLAVLIPLGFFFQRLRTAFWAMIGFLLSLFIGVLGGGITNTVKYFTDIFPKLMAEQYNLFWANFSLGASIDRVFTFSNLYVNNILTQENTHFIITPLLDSPALGTTISQVARIILAVCTLATLGMSWFIKQKYGDRDLLYDLSLGFLLLATLLLIPLGWAATQVLVLLPVALLFSEKSNSAIYSQVRITLLWIANILIVVNSYWAIYAMLFYPSAIFPWWIMTLGTLGILLVWMFFGFRIWSMISHKFMAH